MLKSTQPICVVMVLLLTTLACVSIQSPQEKVPPLYQSAILSVFPDNATFTGEEIPGALYDFCWPPRTGNSGSGFFEVYEDGVLDGQCTSKSSDETLQRKGNITGNYNPQTEEVSFRVETTNIFVPHPEGKVTLTIVFEGQGPVTNNTASGTGNFVYTCSAEGESVYCLGERTSLSTKGTMPFQMDFIESPES